MALETKGNTKVANLNNVVKVSPPTQKVNLTELVNKASENYNNYDDATKKHIADILNTSYNYQKRGYNENSIMPNVMRQNPNEYWDPTSAQALHVNEYGLNVGWQDSMQDINKLLKQEQTVFGDVVRGLLNFGKNLFAGAYDGFSSIADIDNILMLALGNTDYGVDEDNALTRWVHKINEDLDKELTTFADGSEGTLSWVNWVNQIGQLGYSAGIIAEAIGEQILLTKLTALTGGATSSVQMAAASAKIDKIFKLGKLGTKALNALGKTSKFLSKGSIFGALQGIKEVGMNSRETYEAAKEKLIANGIPPTEAEEAALIATKNAIRTEGAFTIAMSMLQWGVFGKIFGPATKNPFTRMVKGEFSWGASDAVTSFLEKGLGKIANPTLKTAGGVIANALGESFEEMGQGANTNYWVEDALNSKGVYDFKTKWENTFDESFWQSAIGGALGGLLFGSVQNIRSRKGNERLEQERGALLESSINAYKNIYKKLDELKPETEHERDYYIKQTNALNVYQAMLHDYANGSTGSFEKYFEFLQSLKENAENGQIELLPEGMTIKDIDSMINHAEKIRNTLIDNYQKTDDDFDLAFEMTQKIESLNQLNDVVSHLEESYNNANNDSTLNIAYNSIKDKAIVSEIDDYLLKKDKYLEHKKNKLKEFISEHKDSILKKQEEKALSWSNQNPGKELSKEERDELNKKATEEYIKEKFELLDETESVVKEFNEAENKVNERIQKNELTNETLDVIDKGQKPVIKEILDKTKNEQKELEELIDTINTGEYQQEYRRKKIEEKTKELVEKVKQIEDNPNYTKKQKEYLKRELVGFNEGWLNRAYNWITGASKGLDKNGNIVDTDKSSKNNTKGNTKKSNKKETEFTQKSNVAVFTRTNPNNVTLDQIIADSERITLNEDGSKYIVEDENGNKEEYDRVHTIKSLKSDINKPTKDNIEAAISEIENNPEFDDVNLKNKLISALQDYLLNSTFIRKIENVKNDTSFSKLIQAINEDISQTTDVNNLKEAVEKIYANIEEFEKYHLTLGNAVDNVAREVLKNPEISIDSAFIQNIPNIDMIENLEAVIERFRQTALEFKKHGYKLHTDSVKFSMKFPKKGGGEIKVAGEVDVLVVDEKTNTVVGIWDVKSIGTNYPTKGFGNNVSTQDGYREQISLYADLLYHKYGITLGTKPLFTNSKGEEVLPLGIFYMGFNKDLQNLSSGDIYEGNTKDVSLDYLASGSILIDGTGNIHFYNKNIPDLNFNPSSLEAKVTNNEKGITPEEGSDDNSGNNNGESNISNTDINNELLKRLEEIKQESKTAGELIVKTLSELQKDVLTDLLNTFNLTEEEFITKINQFLDKKEIDFNNPIVKSLLSKVAIVKDKRSFEFKVNLNDKVISNPNNINILEQGTGNNITLFSFSKKGFSLKKGFKDFLREGELLKSEISFSNNENISEELTDEEKLNNLLQYLKSDEYVDIIFDNPSDKFAKNRNFGVTLLYVEKLRNNIVHGISIIKESIANLPISEQYKILTNAVKSIKLIDVSPNGFDEEPFYTIYIDIPYTDKYLAKTSQMKDFVEFQEDQVAIDEFLKEFKTKVVEGYNDYLDRLKDIRFLDEVKTIYIKKNFLFQSKIIVELIDGTKFTINKNKFFNPEYDLEKEFNLPILNYIKSKINSNIDVSHILVGEKSSIEYYLNQSKKNSATIISSKDIFFFKENTVNISEENSESNNNIINYLYTFNNSEVFIKEESNSNIPDEPEIGNSGSSIIEDNEINTVNTTNSTPTTPITTNEEQNNNSQLEDNSLEDDAIYDDSVMLNKSSITSQINEILDNIKNINIAKEEKQRLFELLKSKLLFSNSFAESLGNLNNQQQSSIKELVLNLLRDYNVFFAKGDKVFIPFKYENGIYTTEGNMFSISYIDNGKLVTIEDTDITLSFDENDTAFVNINGINIPYETINDITKSASLEEELESLSYSLEGYMKNDPNSNKLNISGKLLNIINRINSFLSGSNNITMKDMLNTIFEKSNSIRHTLSDENNFKNFIQIYNSVTKSNEDWKSLYFDIVGVNDDFLSDMEEALEDLTGGITYDNENETKLKEKIDKLTKEEKEDNTFKGKPKQSHYQEIEDDKVYLVDDRQVHPSLASDTYSVALGKVRTQSVADRNLSELIEEGASFPEVNVIPLTSKEELDKYKNIIGDTEYNAALVIINKIGNNIEDNYDKVPMILMAKGNYIGWFPNEDTHNKNFKETARYNKDLNKTLAQRKEILKRTKNNEEVIVSIKDIKRTGGLFIDNYTNISSAVELLDNLNNLEYKELVYKTIKVGLAFKENEKTYTLFINGRKVKVDLKDNNSWVENVIMSGEVLGLHNESIQLNVDEISFNSNTEFNAQSIMVVYEGTTKNEKGGEVKNYRIITTSNETFKIDSNLKDSRDNFIGNVLHTYVERLLKNANNLSNSEIKPEYYNYLKEFIRRYIYIDDSTFKSIFGNEFNSNVAENVNEKQIEDILKKFKEALSSNDLSYNIYPSAFNENGDEYYNSYFERVVDDILKTGKYKNPNYLKEFAINPSFRFLEISNTNRTFERKIVNGETVISLYTRPVATISPVEITSSDNTKATTTTNTVVVTTKTKQPTKVKGKEELVGGADLLGNTTFDDFTDNNEGQSSISNFSITIDSELNDISNILHKRVEQADYLSSIMGFSLFDKHNFKSVLSMSVKEIQTLLDTLRKSNSIVDGVPGILERSIVENMIHLINIKRKEAILNKTEVKDIREDVNNSVLDKIGEVIKSITKELDSIRNTKDSDKTKYDEHFIAVYESYLDILETISNSLDINSDNTLFYDVAIEEYNSLTDDKIGYEKESKDLMSDSQEVVDSALEDIENDLSPEESFTDVIDDLTKRSVTKEIRALLSSIAVEQNPNSNKPNILGLDQYYEFDAIFNILEEILHFPIDVGSDFDKMINALKNKSSAYGYRHIINNTIETLERLNNDADLKHHLHKLMFLMNKRYNVAHSIKSENGKLRVLETNSNGANIRTSVKMKAGGEIAIDNYTTKGQVYKDYVNDIKKTYTEISNRIKNGQRYADLVTKFFEKHPKENSTGDIRKDFLLEVLKVLGLNNVDNYEALLENHFIAVPGINTTYYSIEGNSSNNVHSIFHSNSPLTFVFNSFINNIEKGEDKNHLNLSSTSAFYIRDSLAVISMSKFSKSYRDAGKTVSSFSKPRQVNDIMNKLKHDDEYRERLLQGTNKSLLWLKLLHNSTEAREKLFSVKSFSVNVNPEEMDITFQQTSQLNRLRYALAIYSQTIKPNINSVEFISNDVRKNLGIPEFIKVRITNMMYSTMSDKSQFLFGTATALDISENIASKAALKNSNFYNNVDIVLNGLRGFLYDNVVSPELERIKDYYNNPHLYQTAGNTIAYRLFTHLPILNNTEIELNDGSKALVVNILHDVKRYKHAIEGDFNDKIKHALLNTLIDNLKGVSNNPSPQDTQLYSLIEESDLYQSKISKNAFKGNPEELKKALYLELKLNELINSANQEMFLTGDFAHFSSDKYFKSDIFSKELNIPVINNVENDMLDIISDISNAIMDRTSTNHGKRMAMVIAQGNTLANSDSKNQDINPDYIQIMMEDVSSVPNNIESIIAIHYKNYKKHKQYKSIIEPALKALKQGRYNSEHASKLANLFPDIADFFDISTTDAQEYTTIKEHLDILYRQGDITNKQREALMSKYYSQSKKGISAENKFTDKELKVILQPIKPVYAGIIPSYGSNVDRPVYVKSSSYPLVPQITSGLEIDNLRKYIEEVEKITGKNVRASYQSSNKVGAVSKSLKVWNNNGKFNKDLFKDLKEHSEEILTKSQEDIIKNDKSSAVSKSYLVLPRSNFKIQLKVPVKEKEYISMGTQIAKLLFGNGVLDIEGNVFKFGGKNISAESLKNIYYQAYSDLVSLKTLEIFNMLGLDANGNPKNWDNTFAIFRDILIKEAKAKNFSEQKIKMLEEDFENNSDSLDKFVVSLGVNPSSESYQSLIMSYINKRVFSIKLPGTSLITASSAGYLDKVSEKDVESHSWSSKIVYTDNWQGELRGTEINKNGEVTFAQVLMPPKFKVDGEWVEFFDSEGNPNTDFVIKDEETGKYKVKPGSIDGELLKRISFRIPTSAHLSASVIEIAGFLPKEAGDMVIVPDQLITQKGLDFDIDKENIYGYYSKIEETKDEEGNSIKKLVRYRATNSKGKELSVEDASTSKVNVQKTNVNKSIYSPNYFYDNVVEYKEDGSVENILDKKVEDNGYTKAEGIDIPIYLTNNNSIDDTNFEVFEPSDLNKSNKKATIERLSKAVNSNKPILFKSLNDKNSKILETLLNSIKDEDKQLYSPIIEKTITSNTESRDNSNNKVKIAGILDFQNLTEGVEKLGHEILNFDRESKRLKFVNEIEVLTPEENQLYTQIFGIENTTEDALRNRIKKNIIKTLSNTDVLYYFDNFGEKLPQNYINDYIKAAKVLEKPVFVFNGGNSTWYYLNFNEEGRTLIKYNGVPPLSKNATLTGKRLFKSNSGISKGEYLNSIKESLNGLLKNPNISQEEFNSSINDMFSVKEHIKGNIKNGILEDVEKNIKNTLLEVHLSVLSNKEMQSKIVRVLSMERAKAQVKLLNPNKHTFSFMGETSYQQHKASLGAAGKMAIGVYSNSVVKLSQLQQYAKDKEGGLVKLKISYEELSGDIYNSEYVKFGFNVGEESINFDGEKEGWGSLIKAKSLKSDNVVARSLATVLEERQNTATDNEKEQILGNLNVTDDTIGAETMMIMLGFDEVPYNGKRYNLPYLMLKSPAVMQAAALLRGDFDTEKISYKKDTRPIWNKYKEELKNADINNIDIGVIINSLGKDFNTLEKSNKESDKIAYRENIKMLKLFLILHKLGKEQLKFNKITNIHAKKLGSSISEGRDIFKLYNDLVSEKYDESFEGISGFAQSKYVLASTPLEKIKPLFNMIGEAFGNISEYFPDSIKLNKKNWNNSLKKENILREFSLHSYIASSLVTQDPIRLKILYDSSTGSSPLIDLVRSLKASNHILLQNNDFIKSLISSKSDTIGGERLYLNYNLKDSYEENKIKTAVASLLADSTTILAEMIVYSDKGLPNKVRITPKYLAELLLDYSLVMQNSSSYGLIQRVFPSNMVIDRIKGAELILDSNKEDSLNDINLAIYIAKNIPKELHTVYVNSNTTEEKVFTKIRTPMGHYLISYKGKKYLALQQTGEFKINNKEKIAYYSYINVDELNAYSTYKPTEIIDLQGNYSQLSEIVDNRKGFSIEDFLKYAEENQIIPEFVSNYFINNINKLGLQDIKIETTNLKYSMYNYKSKLLKFGTSIDTEGRFKEDIIHELGHTLTITGLLNMGITANMTDSQLKDFIDKYKDVKTNTPKDKAMSSVLGIIQIYLQAKTNNDFVTKHEYYTSNIFEFISATLSNIEFATDLNRLKAIEDSQYLGVKLIDNIISFIKAFLNNILNDKENKVKNTLFTQAFSNSISLIDNSQDIGSDFISAFNSEIEANIEKRNKENKLNVFKGFEGISNFDNNSTITVNNVDMDAKEVIAKLENNDISMIEDLLKSGHKVLLHPSNINSLTTLEEIFKSIFKKNGYSFSVENDVIVLGKSSKEGKTIAVITNNYITNIPSVYKEAVKNINGITINNINC